MTGRYLSGVNTMENGSYTVVFFALYRYSLDKRSLGNVGELGIVFLQVRKLPLN
jgi:hypothetical protein